MPHPPSTPGPKPRVPNDACLESAKQGLGDACDLIARSHEAVLAHREAVLAQSAADIASRVDAMTDVRRHLTASELRDVAYASRGAASTGFIDRWTAEIDLLHAEKSRLTSQLEAERAQSKAEMDTLKSEKAQLAEAWSRLGAVSVEQTRTISQLRAEKDAERVSARWRA